MPDNVSNRLDRERLFHDRQAADRQSCPRFSEELARPDSWYLDHASWIRFAVQSLGNVESKTVLDWGCGHGMAACLLAGRGAKVVATDVSAGYCREVLLRAGIHQVAIRTVQADAVRLPLPDASIDAIWGHAILHHLPFDKAMRELRRVLKPHGRLVLSDPFEGGFAVRWARMASGCWNGHQTIDEQPITWHVLNAIKEYFPAVMATFWDIPGVYSGQLSGCWPDNMRWNHSLARYVVISNHALV